MPTRSIRWLSSPPAWLNFVSGSRGAAVPFGELAVYAIQRRPPNVHLHRDLSLTGGGISRRICAVRRACGIRDTAAPSKRSSAPRSLVTGGGISRRICAVRKACGTEENQMGHSRDQPKTSWGCRGSGVPTTLSRSIYEYETDRLSGRQALLEGDGAAGGAGCAAKCADEFLPARRYAHGFAPRRCDALCRRHGGAVGLDGGALKLRTVFRHERVYLSILGHPEPQGHPPRDGTGASDGAADFRRLPRRCVLCTGMGVGTVQQRPGCSGRRLPVSENRLLFLSGGGADVSFV